MTLLLPSGHQPQSSSLTLLGTGTSLGVPVVGCRCPVCVSENPRNSRYRSGVLVTAPEGNLVIDTSPELRLQLLREQVNLVHAALFTHAHADHIFGLDDLRIFGYRLDSAITLYCEEPVEQVLRQAFSYAFTPPDPQHPFGLPRFEFQRINEFDAIPVLGLLIRPLRFIHGKLPILGFRINDVAFCTDVSEIPRETLPLLKNLDTLILGALRDEPHPTHFSIGQALDAIEQIQPRQAFLTHLSHSLEYEATNARLPSHVKLAHDGLSIPL